MAVRAGKAAFEHLEDALVPGRDLVAVDVLKGGTLDAGDVLFVVGTEDIDLLAKQLDHIASRRGADDSHEVRPPELPHQGKHIALQSAQRVAHEHEQPFALGGEDALRDGHGTVEVGLAGAGGPGLDVPTVGAVAEVFFLKLSQWHCLHLPAAHGPLPARLRRDRRAGHPRPASSAVPRPPADFRAWPVL